MLFLRDNRYTAVSLEKALQSLSRNEDTKYVVITFDDGFRDFYSAAYPILSEFGFLATVFLATGLITDPRLQWKSADLMTWAEVRELQTLGIRFGSHTVSHPELDRLDEKQIEREVGESKQTLEDKLGAPVSRLRTPTPFQRHNPAFTNRLGEILEQHSYQNGVSTVIGRAQSCDNRLFLPRLPVNTWDDSRLFQTKLEGGYDWLHLPQSVYKRVRRLRLQSKVPERNSLNPPTGSTSRMDLSIVIVNWNSVEFLRPCLRASTARYTGSTLKLLSSQCLLRWLG